MRTDTPILPQEIEIERIVLGAVLIREDLKLFETVRRELEPSAWTVPFNREVFLTMSALAERGDSINPITLQTEMQARGTGYKDTPVQIMEMTNGVPFQSNLKTEIRRLKDVFTLREIMRCSDAWMIEAQARDVDVAGLVAAITSRAADFGHSTTVEVAPLSISWAQACEMAFPPWESILNGIGRGEVVNCSAITERGKSTLWRNICLSAAVGREFVPVLKAGPPRRILYLDFETRWPRLRPDIMKMLGQFTQAERAMVAENLHIIADCRIDGLALSLSDRKHWAFFEAEVERLRPDIVVIDTLSVAFNIQNELDNSEAARNMKKICGLAEKFGCTVVFLHHIGKVKQEEGQTAYSVYRSRGASAYSANAQAIINLLPDPSNRDRFTLECPKLKGEKWADTVFDIDRAIRWCVSAGTPAPVPTPYDRVVGAFNGQPIKQAEILKMMSDIPERTVKRCLSDAIEKGDLIKPGHGVYAKPGYESENEESKVPKCQPYRVGTLALSTQDEENKEDVLDWGEESENDLALSIDEYPDDPIDD